MSGAPARRDRPAERPRARHRHRPHAPGAARAGAAPPANPFARPDPFVIAGAVLILAALGLSFVRRGRLAALGRDAAGRRPARLRDPRPAAARRAGLCGRPDLRRRRQRRRLDPESWCGCSRSGPSPASG